MHRHVVTPAQIRQMGKQISAADDPRHECAFSSYVAWRLLLCLGVIEIDVFPLVQVCFSATSSMRLQDVFPILEEERNKIVNIMEELSSLIMPPHSHDCFIKFHYELARRCSTNIVWNPKQLPVEWRSAHIMPIIIHSAPKSFSKISNDANRQLPFRELELIIKMVSRNVCCQLQVIF